MCTFLFFTCIPQSKIKSLHECLATLWELPKVNWKAKLIWYLSYRGRKNIKDEKSHFPLIHSLLNSQREVSIYKTSISLRQNQVLTYSILVHNRNEIQIFCVCVCVWTHTISFKWVVHGDRLANRFSVTTPLFCTTSVCQRPHV